MFISILTTILNFVFLVVLVVLIASSITIAWVFVKEAFMKPSLQNYKRLNYTGTDDLISLFETILLKHFKIDEKEKNKFFATIKQINNPKVEYIKVFFTLKNKIDSFDIEYYLNHHNDDYKPFFVKDKITEYFTDKILPLIKLKIKEDELYANYLYYIDIKNIVLFTSYDISLEEHKKTDLKLQREMRNSSVFSLLRGILFYYTSIKINTEIVYKKTLFNFKKIVCLKKQN